MAGPDPRIKSGDGHDGEGHPADPLDRTGEPQAREGDRVQEEAP